MPCVGRSRCRSGRRGALAERRGRPRPRRCPHRRARPRGDGYHGLDVVRAARISGSAHGGQILVSSATRDLVRAALEDVTFEDMGEYRLKDLEQPQRIYQVTAPGLAADFPPLETADVARVMTIGGREQELATAAEAALATEERRVRLFRRSRVVALAGALLLADCDRGRRHRVTSELGRVRDRGGSRLRCGCRRQRGLVGDVPIGGRPISLAVGTTPSGLRTPTTERSTARSGRPPGGEDDRTRGRRQRGRRRIRIGLGRGWQRRDAVPDRSRRDAVEATLRLGKADPLRPEPVFFVAAG